MPLKESQAEILKKYGGYVRSIAATVRKQFHNQVEMDDLVSYGQVGLLEAASRFDVKVGVNFLTFAHYRIKGAIFDGLRRMGVVGGGENRVSERANAFLTNLSDRDVATGARTLDDDVGAIADAVTGLAVIFGSANAGTDSFEVSDQLPPDERLVLEQLRTRVRLGIAKLPENERKLLEAYYFQGKTLEEAGAVIGQSKSWASRLHARAVESLKKFLADEATSPPGLR